MNLTNRPTSADKVARLRESIATGTVTMPGCFNAPVAMMAQQLGFEAIYISGAGIINGLAGFPDIALLGMEEVARTAAYVARCVDVPAICDADTGFGEVLQTMHTVQTFESAGVAGIHLEDQVMPKRCGHLDGKRLVSSQDMERKLTAAATASASATSANGLDPDKPFPPASLVLQHLLTQAMSVYCPVQALQCAFRPWA